jgi:hypothetical protein
MRAVGLTSLFAVLIALCLTVFAVLAWITARSELALAERGAELVTAFYEAEYRAVMRLNEAVESGTFGEEIDDNRELRVTWRIIGGEITIDEWVVVHKSPAAAEMPAETPEETRTFAVPQF